MKKETFGKLALIFFTFMILFAWAGCFYISLISGLLFCLCVNQYGEKYRKEIEDWKEW